LQLENIFDKSDHFARGVFAGIYNFVDDVFTLQRKWTMEFAEVYARRCRLPFSINARFDNVDADMVAALADAGLCLVYAGVESGNEHIRNTVMKRRQKIDSMAAAAELYHRHGVKLLTENVLGAPGETYAQARETLAVNLRIRPAIANASLFTPYPKLEMTRYAIERGYFDGDFDKLDSNYYHGTVLRFDDERDKRRIVNLRCFFGLLNAVPALEPVITPLLDLPPNPLFRWAGDLLDGFFLWHGLPYRQSLAEFAALLKHYVSSYRSTGNRTAEAKRPRASSK
jgi:radical SAM superfamily enzyme YgiQ (UPF0313 family)